VLAVALPQRLDQLGALLRPLGVQPLLELIDHQQDLGTVRGGCTPAAPGCPAPPQLGEGLDQPDAIRQFGAALAQGPEQSGLGLARRGLDVNGLDVLRQPGQQPGLDQR